jgi:hypothetical protein
VGWTCLIVECTYLKDSARLRATSMFEESSVVERTKANGRAQTRRPGVCYKNLRRTGSIYPLAPAELLVAYTYKIGHTHSHTEGRIVVRECAA